MGVRSKYLSHYTPSSPFPRIWGFYLSTQAIILLPIIFPGYGGFFLVLKPFYSSHSSFPDMGFRVKYSSHYTPSSLLPRIWGFDLSTQSIILQPFYFPGYGGSIIYSSHYTLAGLLPRLWGFFILLMHLYSLLFYLYWGFLYIFFSFFLKEIFLIFFYISFLAILFF